MKPSVQKGIERIEIEIAKRWASRKINYSTHKCNGQDGSDISFTKKDFEALKEVIFNELKTTAQAEREEVTKEVFKAIKEGRLKLHNTKED